MAMGGRKDGTPYGPRMKSRLLRSLIHSRVPRLDPEGEDWCPEPGVVESVLEELRVHSLLTERLHEASADDNAVAAWGEAVDEWVLRLLDLASSKNAFKCWFAVCFLGITIEECTPDRFVRSFPVWFEKTFDIFQSSISQQKHIVASASCASISDLFVRVSKFSNLKKMATSFAGKVVQHILKHINGDCQVMEIEIDLLCTFIKLFPSSAQRHYDKMESDVALRILSGSCSEHTLKKYASCLAIMPCAKNSEDCWRLLMEKIILAVNKLLTDAFLGLEDENEESEIMRLLVPLGRDPPPPLGGQTKPGKSLSVTKGSRVAVVPTISALIHCICMMLNGPYAGQVIVPTHSLLAVVRRVLQIDGLWQKSNFRPSTDLQHELVCSELPLIQSYILDLLIAMIEGIGSGLLPHAYGIAHIIKDYFGRVSVPVLRIKVYHVLQLLSSCMGFGFSSYVVQELVANAYNDLNDNHGSIALPCAQPPQESYVKHSRKRKSKKRKLSSASEQQPTNTAERDDLTRSDAQSHGDCLLPTPVSVKIAALQALESLLVVGGSIRSEEWRPEVDLLLVNAARTACDLGWGYEESPATRDSSSSLASFQLVALKALLASFLSLSCVRPPHLSQGLELFHRGKLEACPMVAGFCTQALLSLEVLIHPRVQSLDEQAYRSSATNGRTQDTAVFGVSHEIPVSENRGGPGSSNIVDDDDWFEHSDEEQPVSHFSKEKASRTLAGVVAALNDVTMLDSADAAQITNDEINIVNKTQPSTIAMETPSVTAAETVGGGINLEAADTETDGFQKTEASLGKLNIAESPRLPRPSFMAETVGPSRSVDSGSTRMDTRMADSADLAEYQSSVGLVYSSGTLPSAEQTSRQEHTMDEQVDLHTHNSNTDKSADKIRVDPSGLTSRPLIGEPSAMVIPNETPKIDLTRCFSYPSWKNPDDDDLDSDSDFEMPEFVFAPPDEDSDEDSDDEEIK